MNFGLTKPTTYLLVKGDVKDKEVFMSFMKERVYAFIAYARPQLQTDVNQTLLNTAKRGIIK